MGNQSGLGFTGPFCGKILLYLLRVPFFGITVGKFYPLNIEFPPLHGLSLGVFLSQAGNKGRVIYQRHWFVLRKLRLYCMDKNEIIKVPQVHVRRRFEAKPAGFPFQGPLCYCVKKAESCPAGKGFFHRNPQKRSTQG
jgi:hypothetical protein